MAISSGAGPHFAWINGFLIKSGSVTQSGFNRKSGSFSCTIPMFLRGALGAFSGGASEAVIMCSTHGISGVLMVGEIDSVDFDFIGTTIHISGRDKSAKIHNKKSAEKWQNKTGSDITQELVGRAGLSGGGGGGGSKGMAGKKLEKDFVKLTDGIGFSTVIHLLSQFDGVGWHVDKEGNFQYGTGGGGSYSLNYKHPPHMVSDTMGLRVHLNVQAMKGANVTVKSWHPKEKKLYTGKSKAGGGGGGGEPNEYTYHIPTLNQEQADQHAKSRAKEHARHAITITANVAGDPSIDAGGSVSLSGTPFDGSYKIDTVHHQVGMSGHTMTITAKSSGGEEG
jgi:hypothetical protein